MNTRFVPVFIRCKFTKNRNFGARLAVFIGKQNIRTNKSKQNKIQRKKTFFLLNLFYSAQNDPNNRFDYNGNRGA